MDSNSKARRIAFLLAGYMRETITSQEHDELCEWVGASDKNMRLFEELTDPVRVKLALELLDDRISNSKLTELVKETNPAKYYRFRARRKWARIAAIVFLVSWAIVGMYHVFIRDHL